jgi:hypothetical protein
MEIAGKKAVVLGGTSGIGLATKWAAASQGALGEPNPFPGSVLVQSGSGSQNRLFQPLKVGFFFLLQPNHPEGPIPRRDHPQGQIMMILVVT